MREAGNKAVSACLPGLGRRKKGAAMKKKGRAYSPKEKKACLKQLKEGKSFAQVSRESGVSASTLRKWSKEEESGGQESSS